MGLADGLFYYSMDYPPVGLDRAAELGYHMDFVSVYCAVRHERLRV
jgi:hypothetical protein